MYASAKYLGVLCLLAVVSADQFASEVPAATGAAAPYYPGGKN